MNIIEAAEQSERLSVPELDNVINLNDLIDNFPDDRCLVFCNENDKNLPIIYDALNSKINKYSKWAILIGPEGGFLDEEVERILTLPNILSVSLGQRILRSDTATTAAIFSLQSLIEKN